MLTHWSYIFIALTHRNEVTTLKINLPISPGEKDIHIIWQRYYHGIMVVFVLHTVYPKKYAHGFVVLCFVVVMQSFIMNSHEVFIHIHQGCFAGTGAIVRLPQCQWSKPDGYGKISQCITTTKHSKAKTVCIILGIYCMLSGIHKPLLVFPILVMISAMPYDVTGMATMSWFTADNAFFLARDSHTICDWQSSHANPKIE